jgi:hypothetical protein
MIDPKQFEELIQNQIAKSVKDELGELLSSREWVNKLRQVALNQVIAILEKELKTAEFDNKIKDYIFEAFKTLDFNGIDDCAYETELTIMPGTVVAENELVAKDIRATESITVEKDLILLGNVNTDSSAWEHLTNTIAKRVTEQFDQDAKDLLVESTLKIAKKDGIHFGEVLVEGKKLIEGTSLGPRVTESNLQKVGTLTNLVVSGDASLSDTVNISKKRVGINTPEPSAALSVWDEEVEVTIGKRAERTGYIGTTRKQHLNIGVNGQANIAINDDGLVVIDQLQIGKQRISHSNKLPGYSGSKGDIVFNIDVSVKNPVFAWMCVGGFNWVALSASVS